MIAHASLVYVVLEYFINCVRYSDCSIRVYQDLLIYLSLPVIKWPLWLLRPGIVTVSFTHEYAHFIR